MKNKIDKKILHLFFYLFFSLSLLSCDKDVSLSGPFFLKKQSNRNSTSTTIMLASNFLNKYRTTENGVRTDDGTEAMAVDQNGKYFLVGSSRNNAVVEKLNSDLSLDTSFGAGGKVILDIGTNSYDSLKSVAVQSDGKVVAAGYTNANGSYDGLIIRLNTDGTLDSTFGTGGKVMLDIGSFTYEDVKSVVIQSDGKILAAGYTSANGSDDALLVRLNSDGSFDTGFGVGGKAITDIGTNSTENVTSMVVQSDGKILIGGSSYGAGLNDVFLLRFSSGGVIDAAFGTAGKVVVDVGTNSDDYLLSMVVQANGKIIIGGSSDKNGSSDILLIRFNTDGSSDASFGTAGVVIQDIGTNTADYLNTMALQADEKIVVGGYQYGGSSDVLLARFNTDGTLDSSSYGTGGKVVLDLSAGNNDSLSSLFIQTDGKVVAAGAMYTNGSDDALLIRFDTAGSVDTSFGTNGKITLNTGTNSKDYFNFSVAQSDGKIVTAGAININGSNDVLLVRYNSDGSIDTTFGTSGRVYYDIGTSSDDYLNSIAIQTDGKIVVGGFTTANGSEDLLLMRFNSNGSLDTSFGASGFVILDIGASTSDYLKSIALQSDGKILIGGYTANASYDVLLVRLNTDGSLDTSFGTAGLLVLDIGSSSADYFKSITVQSDGKILAAGDSSANGSEDVLVARFNSNGSFDASFGSGGKVLVDVGTNSYDYFQAMTLQSDGKIVAIGVSDAGGSNDALLVRYNSDGSLDTAFGTGGKVVLDLGSSSDDISSVVIKSDGGIIVSGQIDVGGWSDAILVGFNSDGSLDSTFGTSGKVTLSFVANKSDYFNNITLQNNGKIVVSGVTDSENGYALLMCLNEDGTF